MKEKEKIYEKILKLKSKNVLSQKDKLKIQLLQQELGNIDDGNKN